MNRDKFIFILGIIFLLFLWSSTYTAIYISLNTFSPEGLALLRFLIASIMMFFISRFHKISLPEKKDIPLILLCGFIGIAFYNIALNSGQKTITAGSASLILNTYPIFVTILSGFILKEVITGIKWLGILISFVGILIITLGENNGFSLNTGALIVLVAAMSISLFDVTQKKLMRKYSPIALTSYFIWAGTFVLLIFSGSLIHDISIVTPKTLVSALYLGLFPGTLAYLIWAIMISKRSVSSLSSVFYAVPFFSMVIAFLFLKQLPNSMALWGGLIAFAGVLILNFSDQIKSNINRLKLKTSLSALKIVYFKQKILDEELPQEIEKKDYIYK